MRSLDVRSRKDDVFFISLRDSVNIVDMSRCTRCLYIGVAGINHDTIKYNAFVGQIENKFEVLGFCGMVEMYGDGYSSLVCPYVI